MIIEAVYNREDVFRIIRDGLRTVWFLCDVLLAMNKKKSATNEVLSNHHRNGYQFVARGGDTICIDTLNEARLRCC